MVEYTSLISGDKDDILIVCEIDHSFEANPKNFSVDDVYSVRLLIASHAFSNLKTKETKTLEQELLRKQSSGVSVEDFQ